MEKEKEQMKLKFEYKLGAIRGVLIGNSTRGYSMRIEKLWYDDKNNTWKSTNWFKPYEGIQIEIVLHELTKKYFDFMKEDREKLKGLKNVEEEEI